MCAKFFLRRDILGTERKNRVMAWRSHGLILQSLMEVDRLMYFRRCTTEHWYWGYMGGDILEVLDICIILSQTFLCSSNNMPTICQRTFEKYVELVREFGQEIWPLGCQPHPDGAVQTWLSRFTCLHVLRITNILAKKEGIKLQRLFVQVLGKLCVQDHFGSWEIPFNRFRYFKCHSFMNK